MLSNMQPVLRWWHFNNSSDQRVITLSGNRLLD